MTNKNYGYQEDENTPAEDKNEESMRIIEKGGKQIKKQSLPVNPIEEGIFSKTISFNDNENDNEIKLEVQLNEQLQEIIGCLHVIVNQLDILGKYMKK